MIRAQVVIERRFRLNNLMLSDLRAAGHYEGYGRAMQEAGQWRRRQPGRDLFAEEVADIRNVVCLHFKRLQRIGRAAAVDVSVWFLGHGKHDGDAGSLAAKAIVDGMADAGFVASDRFDVRRVESLVVRAGEAKRELPSWCVPPGAAWAGVVIEVREVRHAN